MACNDVDISEIQSASGNHFDFNQWVKDHQLCEIKDLLLKHDLNTITTLSLTSPQYIQFLCDPQLLQTKSHFIPNIVKAIQSLNTSSIISLNNCIFMSEAEESVMKALKQHSVELKSTEIHIKELKIKYPELIQVRIERGKQIEKAEQKIKHTFKGIKDALNKREQYLLNELNTIKEEIIDNDDEKGTDLFVEVENALTKQMQKITETSMLCDEAIMSHKNEKREKRKEIILNIGKQLNQGFDLEIQNINKTVQMLNQLISKKEGYDVEIGCFINELKCNKLLKNINNLGVIASIQQSYEMIGDVAEVSDDDIDEMDGNDDIDLIKWLKEKIAKYKQSLYIKNEEMAKLQQQFDALNTVQANYDVLQRKYNELKVKNDQNIDSCAHCRQIIAAKNKCTEWEQKHQMIQQQYQVMQQQYNAAQNQMVDALKFRDSSLYRWYNEEKEQYVVVKTVDEGIQSAPSVFVRRYCNVNRISVDPKNTKNMREIASCIVALKNQYESCANKLNWKCFDCWSNNYKSADIEIFGDIICSNSEQYRSIFGGQICKTPFKYHWKIKQISDHSWDYYIGVMKTGNDMITLKNTYFCKSKTGYGFTGVNAQLYANDKWGRKYGEKCRKRGDVIDVYLDLRNNTLSYTINGTNYKKAYDVEPGEYRLAVTICKFRILQLISSYHTYY